MVQLTGNSLIQGAWTSEEVGSGGRRGVGGGGGAAAARQVVKIPFHALRLVYSLTEAVRRSVSPHAVLHFQAVSNTHATLTVSLQGLPMFDCLTNRALPPPPAAPPPPLYPFPVKFICGVIGLQAPTNLFCSIDTVTLAIRRRLCTPTCSLYRRFAKRTTWKTGGGVRQKEKTRSCCPQD